MKAIDIHGMTNMELVRGETDEWYWATDYIHGDLYEAEELFRQGHPVRSNRLYLIHYPDGTVYEAVSSTNRSHFDSDLCFLPPFARRIFRCFRPALPAPILFWVKSGSEVLYERFAKRKSPPQVFHIRATPISYFGTIYISGRGCIINLNDYKSCRKRY